MAVFYVLTAGYVYLVRDVRFVDDHGLAAVPAPLAEADNAFPLLLNATNGLVPSPDWVKTWNTNGSDWNMDAAREWVASNEQAVAAISAALVRDAYQGSRSTNFSQIPPYLSPFRDLARLLKVKSELHLAQGELKEAVDTAVQLAKLGDLLQGGNASFIEWLVGRTIKVMGFDQALNVGTRLKEKQDIIALERRLRPYASVPGVFQACADEYARMCAEIEPIASGQIPLPELLSITCGPADMKQPGAWMPYWLRRFLIRPFLQPNRTKQKMADGYKEFADRSGAPLKECFGPAIQSLKDVQGSSGWFHRNIIGRIMINVMTLDFDAIRERLVFLECQANSVRLMLALRAFHLDTGSWPQTLQPLVPDYLPAVPRDPYDGAPFRYHAPKRIVYAIGPDFADNGGAIEKGADGESKDIGLVVEE